MKFICIFLYYNLRVKFICIFLYHIFRMKTMGIYLHSAMDCGWVPENETTKLNILVKYNIVVFKILNL